MMSYISKKHLSRRTVLRGMGVTVALPVLDAMLPASTAFAKTAAAASSSKTRLICMEMVHGSAGATPIGLKKNLWSPEKTGADFDLSATSLSPLEPFRDHITIVSNTDVRNAEAFTLPEIGGDHFRRERTDNLMNKLQRVTRRIRRHVRQNGNPARDVMVDPADPRRAEES